MIRNQCNLDLNSPLVADEKHIVQNTGTFGSLQVLPPAIFPTSSPSVLALRRSHTKKFNQLALYQKQILEEKKVEGDESPATKKLKDFQNKYSNSISWLDRVQEIEELEETSKKNQRIKNNSQQSSQQILQKPTANSLLAKRSQQGRINLRINTAELGKKQ